MGKAHTAKKEKDPDALPVKAIAVFTVLAFVIMAFFALLVLFRVKRVEVTGNIHNTDHEIRDSIMVGPMSNNTLLLSLFNRHPKMENADFIDHISVEYLNRNSLRVRVSEKNAVGYLAFENAYWYFDENGIVTVMTTAPERRPYSADEELPFGELDSKSDGTPRETYIIPCVEGVMISDAQVGSVLAVSDPSIFATITSITGMINKNGIVPDRVVLMDDSTWTMICGTITVLLGKDEHLEDKIEELAGILPAAEGLSGVLHLENFDGTQNRIIFDKSPGSGE